MNRDREERILQKAIQKGLVHPEGLVLLEKMLVRHGPRLGSLIGVGRLDAEKVRAIELEIDREDGVAPPVEDLTAPVAAAPAPPAAQPAESASEATGPVRALTVHEEPTVPPSPALPQPAVMTPSGKYVVVQAAGEKTLDRVEAEAPPTESTEPGTKRRTRRRWTAAMGATAVVVIIATSFVAYNRWVAAKRLRIAQQLEQESTKAESIMSEAYGQPLHDTRPDKERAMQAMRRIEDQMKNQGRLADGPGYLAMARCYMSVNDCDEARKHLELAARAGEKGPAIDQAFGMTLGVLAREQLVEARNMPDQKERARQIASILDEYAVPATAHLRKPLADEDRTRDYAASLILFFEDNLDDASARAETAASPKGSPYEAKLLQGDILLAKALQGDDPPDRKLVAFRRAEDAYRQAVQIQESNPRGHEALCVLWTDLLRMDRAGDGRDAAAHNAAAAADGEKAVTADPDRPAAYMRLADSQRLYGDIQIRQGQDPTETLLRAAANMEEAVRLHGEDASLYLHLGSTQVQLARYFLSTGRDAQTHYDVAVKALQKAVGFNRSMSEAWSVLGAANADLAWLAIARGDESGPFFKAAVSAAEKAADLNPGSAACLRGAAERHLCVAENDVRQGQDPAGSLKKAIDRMTQALEVDPRDTAARVGQATASLIQAGYDLATGQDPRERLREAATSLLSVLDTARPDPAIYAALGRLHLLTARADHATGANPEKSLGTAIGYLKKALDLDPLNALRQNGVGAALLQKGEVELDLGRPPVTTLAEARGFLRRAYTINPSLSDAHLNLGRVELLSARSQAAKGKDPSDFVKRARIALETALADNRGDPEIYRTLGELSRFQAQWKSGRKQPVAEDTNTGLLMAEKALAINPKMAEALALQGALHLMQAQSLPAKSQKRGEAIQQAAESLQKALEMNPLILQKKYGPLLKEAKRLK